MKCIPLVIALLLAFVAATFAQTVSVKNGNVYIKDAHATRQLTTSGHDSDPSLSPDGRTVVFVRGTPGKLVSHGAGEDEATELWLVGADANNATMLLRGKEASDAKQILAGLSAPQFSPDGKKIYFASAAWATSGAIHIYDLSAKREKFLCDGNDLKIVRAGEYKGDLLVMKHKYFLGGGSYDWYWLIKPDGTEVGPVGENPKNFLDLYND